MSEPPPNSSQGEPRCPDWARRLFLEDVKPKREDPGFSDWVSSYLRQQAVYASELWAGYRELWARYRDELIREWIVKNAGRRPPAWWLYDAPEMRQELPGQGVTTDSPLARVIWREEPGSRDRFIQGIPRLFPEGPHDDLFEGTAKVESQATFLRRHNLLLEGEAERLEPEAFEPESITFE